MDRAERIQWLKEHTQLASLSDETLEAIAAAIVEEPFQENRRLVLEETPPEALYILKAGHLESYHTSLNGPAKAVGLLPGSIIHLKELLLDQAAEQTVITLGDGLLWQIAKEPFLALAQQYPEISRTFSRQLAAELNQLTSQLAYEQERQTALRPYAIPRVRRGVIGSSEVAVRLRKQVRDAARDRTPVLLTGEAGVGKVNLAALIHFNSAARREPLIRFNCGTLSSSGAELFGRVAQSASGKQGLLAYLGSGTLVLDHLQDLLPELQAKVIQLLQTGEYRSISREGEPIGELQQCQARIIVTAERSLDQVHAQLSLEPGQALWGHAIEVPPLRDRKADIKAKAEYHITCFARGEGISRPKLTPEAAEVLASYDFPGNLPELESLLEQAISQSNGAAELTADLFRSAQQLAVQLDQVASQLAFEQERQTALRPYLVPKVRRGIVGSSRYAVRLRQEIKKAASDRKSVLVFGEPGLGKDNTAALIHFGSRDRHQPMIKINCNTLQASGAELFGRVGGKPGLLEWIGQGTLLLNNIQELLPALLEKILLLLETGTYAPISREGEPTPEPKQSHARIMMVSEKSLPQLERKHCVQHVIKVPPLRVRKADIAAQAEYYISLTCRTKDIARPHVTPEALRRLQGYDFPGNFAELEGLIERAIAQSNGAPELTEEVFWAVSNKTRRFRVNLLNAYPKLRQFLRSDWWPDRINFGFTLGFFAVIVSILMLGPQARDSNIGLNLFWAWWWPLMLVAFPFVGRLWCSVCPFMIYGELAQKLSLRLFPRELLPWPRQQAEKWGGWFLFGLFTLILLWEELWHLENTAYLSGCLLLLITAGAVIFSLLFERRFWCRYLCPIGGMNGLFAKLSMTELRAQQGICSATCTTYQCYKGGPEKGEGQESLGCPLYSHPAQLEDNRDCVLCMTCLKACPHRSVEVNLRPPGIELWTTHQPTYAEVALLFLLFGAIFLHRLPEIENQLGWNFHLENFGWHAGVSAVALLLPVAIALLAQFLIQAINRTLKPRPFLELAYGYLPLVLGGSLAHYLRLGLTEAGRVLPITLATFGYSSVNVPIAVAEPAVIAFLQAVTLIASVWLSVILTQKIARQPLLSLLPQHLATLAIGSLLWKLIVS
ncbi:MAG: sigma 54-interacting transcriptional regulator [Trichocoleus desertorum ATA4-8-CV12]|jgi:transcriptional regulator with AAA-type ATPase domain/NAD-dependent dihydropyrimidine dehydrogenase PreA subunit|nr:sigma 54-interacting transcriptional regulator [Trichocoleus desertorum ATA4-8-CV12]